MAQSSASHAAGDAAGRVVVDLTVNRFTKSVPVPSWLAVPP